MNKYSSIENLYKITEILNLDEVIVEEKLHGTNARIGIGPNGVITPGGRNLEFASPHFNMDYVKHTDDSYNFGGFLWDNGLFHSIANTNIKNITIYGEFIGPNIQKGVNYGPDKNFYIFDIFDDLSNAWFRRENVEIIAGKMCLNVVPLLYRGKPNMDIFKLLYDANSTVGTKNGVEGENICEGIVIKPAVANLKDRFGNRLIAKYKNEKWAEKAKKTVTNKEPVDDAPYRSLVEMYVNANRLEHVIQHLIEDGKIKVIDLTAAGEVVREMINDVMKEADTEDLEGIDSKRVGKYIGPATISLFKEKLMNVATQT